MSDVNSSWRSKICLCTLASRSEWDVCVQLRGVKKCASVTENSSVDVSRSERMLGWILKYRLRLLPYLNPDPGAFLWKKGSQRGYGGFPLLICHPDHDEPNWLWNSRPVECIAGFEARKSVSGWCLSIWVIGPLIQIWIPPEAEDEGVFVVNLIQKKTSAIHHVIMWEGILWRNFKAQTRNLKVEIDLTLL